MLAILRWAGLGLLGLVLLAVVIVAGFAAFMTLLGELGWEELPGDAPSESTVFDRRYEQAARTGLDRIEAMRLEHGVPGVTAAVAIDGALVWTGAAGWSDLETMTPMSADAILRIGSTSKAMTATALARLSDQGVIAMTDTVGAHIPEPLNPDWASLQLRQLMSHTAGMPGYEENTDWDRIDTLLMRGAYDSVEAGLRLVDDSDLIFPAGSDFHYSSFDVNLAALTGARAAGLTFPGLLSAQIREPLALDTPLPGDFGERPASEVQYYQTRRRDAAQVRDWNANVSQRWPGGGLTARSRDLVMVASAWLDPDFIAPQTREAFWTPVRLDDGTVNAQNYALGWRVDAVTSRFGEDHEPVRMAHHGGVSRGAMSWLAVYPELGIAVAVNINTNTPEFRDFAGVEQDILRVFADAAGRRPAVAASSN